MKNLIRNWSVIMVLSLLTFSLNAQVDQLNVEGDSHIEGDLLIDGDTKVNNGVFEVIAPGTSTGEVSINSPGTFPGLIFRSNDPDYYRAQIFRTDQGLFFGTHENTTGPPSRMGILNNGDLALFPKDDAAAIGGTLCLKGTGAAASDWYVDNFQNEMRIFANGAVMMYIQSDGKIRIGQNVTPTGNYRLFVRTGIMTEKVKIATVNSADWADYVFAKDYPLLSLPEIKRFVKKNKHLPNIPSAKEVEKNGYELQDMDAKLLAKVEELYIHAIDLDEENQELKKANEELKKLIQKLDKRIEALEGKL